MPPISIGAERSAFHRGPESSHTPTRPYTFAQTLGAVGAARAGEDDGLAEKVDISEVGAGGEEGAAVVGAVVPA